MWAPFLRSGGSWGRAWAVVLSLVLCRYGQDSGRRRRFDVLLRQFRFVRAGRVPRPTSDTFGGYAVDNVLFIFTRRHRATSTKRRTPFFGPFTAHANGFWVCCREGPNGGLRGDSAVLPCAVPVRPERSQASFALASAPFSPLSDQILVQRAGLLPAPLPASISEGTPRCWV